MYVYIPAWAAIAICAAFLFAGMTVRHLMNARSARAKRRRDALKNRRCNHMLRYCAGAQR